MSSHIIITNSTKLYGVYNNETPDRNNLIQRQITRLSDFKHADAITQSRLHNPTAAGPGYQTWGVAQLYRKTQTRTDTQITLQGIAAWPGQTVRLQRCIVEAWWAPRGSGPVIGQAGHCPVCHAQIWTHLMLVSFLPKAGEQLIDVKASCRKRWDPRYSVAILLFFLKAE